MDRFRPASKKVLIIDDDLMNIGFLGPVLTEEGYTAIVTRDPARALTMARAKNPDIVLLDVSIPGIDGYELCRRILAQPGLSRLPIIFITSRGDPKDIADGFSAGAVDYLLKPVNRTELLVRMRNHLERGRYERNLAEEKDRFKTLTDSVGEAFILTDPGLTTILYVNPAFSRVFGIEFPQLPAPMWSWRRAFAPGQSAVLRDMIIRSTGGERSLARELAIRLPDGEERWVWLRVSSVGTGSDLGFILVAEDITDRKIVELRSREAAEAEARAAGTIQRALLMNGEEFSAPGMASCFHSEPSRNVDGDFYDIFSCGEGVDVIIGDVMGKGLNAAMVGAGAKAQFLRAYARLGASCRDTGTPRPSAIVSRVNEELAPKLMELDSFFSAQYLRFMRPHAYFEFVDCGHMPLLLWEDGVCWSLKGSNAPIGFFREQEFDAYRIPLHADNRLLAYSDGVTEAKGPEGSMFGEERLFRSLRRFVAGSPDALVDGIRNDLAAHLGGLHSGDDITMAAFAVTGDPPLPEPRCSRFMTCTADTSRLGEIRDAIGALLGCYDDDELDERGRVMAVLAADEAAANIMIHGIGRGRDESGAPIPPDDPAAARELPEFTIDMEAWDTWFSIRMTYPGEAFEWVHTDDASAERLDEHGYGSTLIRASTHSYAVAMSDTGLMRIYLSGRSARDEE